MNPVTPRPVPPIVGPIAWARRALDVELVRRIAQAGFPEIRTAHSAVFETLPGEGGRLTVMAQRAGMTKQAMGELVDDLVRSGLLRKEPDPDDGRARIIRLTRRGWRAARTGRRIYDEIEDELARTIGRRRIDALRSTLGELSAAVARMTDA